MDSRELFERYLQAVRKYLPWQRQDDIVAELRANLDAQREEREAELGRPLSDGEMVDWLKELGPPLQMAARYQAPRYLIGPGLFPMYWHILRLVLLWASVAYGISVVVRVIVESHTLEWVAGQVGGLWGVVLSAAAWVTGAFAVLEFLAERYPEKCPDFVAPASRWSPLSLPPLEKKQNAGDKPRNLMALSAELVVRFAILVWLVLIPQNPYLLMGPAAAYLKTGPVTPLPILQWFYWAVVAVNAVEFLWLAYNILADRWQEKEPLQHLVTKALGLIPVGIIIAAPGRVYLAANPAATHSLPSQLPLAMLNHYIFTGFVVIGFIIAVQFAWDLWKAVAGERNPLRAVL